MIKVQNVNYHYKTFEKTSGFLGSMKDFLGRKYTELVALKAIGFHIAQGESVGLLGANGAGKTTLIKLLTGIMAPTSGTISCINYDPHQRNKHYLKNIGVVLGQKSQLIWDLPPKETLEMLKLIYDIQDQQFNTRLTLLCELLSVEHKLNIPVRKLSLGERMKFELICALIHSPKILFLDEPTIGLDLMSQRAIRAFLKQINQRDNITILLTSHYMTDIEEVSNRVIVLSEGTILDDLPIFELKKKYSQTSKKIITFIEAVPHALSKYQIQPNVAIISNEEYHQWMSQLDLNTIESIVTQEDGFEDIILRLLSRNG